MLRKISETKGGEVTGEWRRLQKEKLYDWYSSQNIIQMIKSSRMKWANMWHVWRREETHTGFSWGNLRERDHLEDVCVDGKILLKWISRSGTGGMYYIDLAQNEDRWRTLANVVMNLRVPQNAGNFLSG
jgi:hypothetical protein